jgi:hypothetical protein
MLTTATLAIFFVPNGKADTKAIARLMGKASHNRNCVGHLANELHSDSLCAWITSDHSEQKAW